MKSRFVLVLLATAIFILVAPQLGVVFTF